MGSTQAAYCGYNPSALLAGQNTSVVFQIQLHDSLYSTIMNNFSISTNTTSRQVNAAIPSSDLDHVNSDIYIYICVHACLSVSVCLCVSTTLSHNMFCTVLCGHAQLINDVVVCNNFCVPSDHKAWNDKLIEQQGGFVPVFCSQAGINDTVLQVC